MSTPGEVERLTQLYRQRRHFHFEAAAVDRQQAVTSAVPDLRFRFAPLTAFAALLRSPHGAAEDVLPPPPPALPADEEASFLDDEGGGAQEGETPLEEVLQCSPSDQPLRASAKRHEETATKDVFARLQASTLRLLRCSKPAAGPDDEEARDGGPSGLPRRQN